jgi:hypothetical protein
VFLAPPHVSVRLQNAHFEEKPHAKPQLPQFDNLWPAGAGHPAGQRDARLSRGGQETRRGTVIPQRFSGADGRRGVFPRRARALSVSSRWSANPGELAGLIRFVVYVLYIDHAALLMSAASAAADVRDFASARRRRTIRPAGDSTRWYCEVAGGVLTRLSELRHSLVHH